MHYHQNLMFCSSSNWYDSVYLCNHMVSISKDEFPEDWNELIVETHETTNLRSDVLEWLELNVKDSRDKAFKEQPKAWDIGSDTYRQTNILYFSIFFRRRKDAFAFIKQWSKYKKPTSFYNYFKDDSRILVDGKLIKDNS